MVEETGGTCSWQALTSAIQTNTRYEFLQEYPVDYMDFKDRYLVRRVRAQAVNRDASDNEIFLAYCFCITMNHDSDMPIPNALIEDIIADVELVKGQSMRLGSDKF